MSNSVELTPKCVRSKQQRLSNNSFVVPPTPLLKKIGFGAGVSVYHLDRMNNGFSNSPWAIKKVNKKFANGELANRIQKEAELLKSFTHPNIVGFRGFKRAEDGREVLAMEECSVSLGDMIEARMEDDCGPFPPDEIVKVASSVASALHYLHNDKQLLHGDMKSHNVLIKGDFDEVKLCDFGVSVEIKGGVGNVEDYVGTSCWSSPEVLADGPLTAKSDIFSFGLVLWEMLSLVPPHIPPISDNDTSLDSSTFCINEEQYGTRPALPDVPLGPEYDKIIEIFNSCTETDYTKRPTAQDILHKLST